MNRPNPTLRSDIACLLVIVFSGLLAYANHLDNPFQFDSVRFLTENRMFADPAQLLTWEFWKAEYTSRSGLFWTFGLNAALHGMSPFGFHLVNLAFHLMNAVLLFLITGAALEYFGWEGTGNERRGVSLFTALLFTLHPIQTESVAYVMSRSELVAGWFYLTGFYFFQRQLAQGNTHSSAAWVRVTLLTGLILILGYSIKPTIATLPAVMTLYFLLGKNADDPLILSLRRRALWLTGALLIAVSLLAAKLISDPYFLAGTPAAVEQIGRQTYCLTQPWVVVFYYLKLLLFPFNLNIDPDIAPVTSWASPRFWASLLVIGSLLTAAWKRGRTRLPFFGLAWFFIVLAPSSSFVTLLDMAAEHRVYLAAWGFFLFITLALLNVVRRVSKNPGKRRTLAGTAALALLIGCAGLTVQRNAVWSDELVLWHDALAKSPNKVRALVNLGHAYTLRNEVDRAIEYYERSLQQNGHYFQTYYNVAVLYLEKGQVDRAFEHFKIAANIDPTVPDVFGRLGDIYMQRQQWKEADAHLRRAVELNPGYAAAFRSLGILHYFYLKDPKTGAAFLKRSLFLNPGQPDADKMRLLISRVP